MASFGKRGRSDFNLWSDDDKQASDSSASTTFYSPSFSHASNASCSSHTTTPSGASGFSHTPTSFNVSHVSMDSLLYVTKGSHLSFLFTILFSLFHFFHHVFLVYEFFCTIVSRSLVTLFDWSDKDEDEAGVIKRPVGSDTCISASDFIPFQGRRFVDKECDL